MRKINDNNNFLNYSTTLGHIVVWCLFIISNVFSKHYKHYNVLDIVKETRHASSRHKTFVACISMDEGCWHSWFAQTCRLIKLEFKALHDASWNMYNSLKSTSKKQMGVLKNDGKIDFWTITSLQQKEINK